MIITTVTDIVTFILRHRGQSNAFKNFSPEELYNAVSFAMADACIVVDSDCFGRLRGVILAELNRELNRLHVVGLIALHHSSMGKFATWLRGQRDRDGFEITAHRRDKFIQYKTERLLDKLIRYYGR